MRDPDLDLTVSRVIHASRTDVWRAWKDPNLFVQWWTPAPVVTTSLKHEFRAGGAFETSMKLADDSVVESGEGCFLSVVENERIVFTDAIRGGWRPNKSSFFSAVIELAEHPEGTRYTATAMHRDKAACQTHAGMGFVEGWGRAIEQLAELASRTS